MIVVGFATPHTQAYVDQRAGEGLSAALVSPGDYEALSRAVGVALAFDPEACIAIEPRHLPGVVELAKVHPEVQAIVHAQRLLVLYPSKKTKRGRAA